MMKWFFLITGSYLWGSVPFGYLAGILIRGVDIRHQGSGNIGATNVFRTVGPAAGLSVLILDFLKGFLPIYFAQIMGADNIIGIMCGIAAIAGHNWTIFLKFKGGKGVATSWGVFLALLPVPTIIVSFVFLIIYLLFKYISLASIGAALVHPLITLLLGQPMELALFSFLAASFVFFRHRSNIKRLLLGKEHRLTG